MAVGTNKGNLSLVDTRVSFSCPHILHFACSQSEGSYIQEQVKQYTSVHFLSDSKKVVTRDLATVKVWDLCNNRQPLFNIPIEEHIETHLTELFEAEMLGDKFKVTETS